MPLYDKEIIKETGRLYEKLRHLDWSEADCALIAPLTLEINRLKKEKNAVILAHSYQTPDIKYGVADFLGDSYGLSIKARDSKAKIIVFCSVYFMAETAKILNPKKTVLAPVKAGCSLAQSITAKDVRDLRKKHPKAGVVCYINTNADVKAECDAVCTSSNALKIIEGMPQNEIIFIPDVLMAKNFQPLTSKKLIPWNGTCIVHEGFKPETINAIKKANPGIEILVHPECSPEVVAKADFTGSTEAMLNKLGRIKNKKIMLVTECGLSDRARVEYPDKEVIGTCALCPYMKEINLRDIYEALHSPRKNQIVKISGGIMQKAKKSLDKMIEIVERK
jgi:quinolinate synthase